MTHPSPRRELIPPQAVIDVARFTMGGIDLDPFSTPEVNHVVQAARFLDRDTDPAIAAGRHWSPQPPGRLFLGVQTGIPLSRALANKALQDYRQGVIQQAILWFGSNEVLTACPWIWDFPICIPFRRLCSCFWDEELEKTIRVPSADWSPIIYLPLASPATAFTTSLARFHAAAAPLGRVILDQWSGESRWPASYEAATRKPYSYSP